MDCTCWKRSQDAVATILELSYGFWCLMEWFCGDDEFTKYHLPFIWRMSCTSVENYGISSKRYRKCYWFGCPLNWNDVVQVLGHVDRSHIAECGASGCYLYLSLHLVILLWDQWFHVLFTMWVQIIDSLKFDECCSIHVDAIISIQVLQRLFFDVKVGCEEIDDHDIKGRYW